MLTIAILAAGEGSRIAAPIPKPLLPLGGRPLIARAVSLARATLGGRRGQIVVVAGKHQAELQRALQEDEARFSPSVKTTKTAVTFVRQPAARGTADAVACALKVARGKVVLVFFVDTPLLPAAALKKLARRGESGAAMMTAAPPSAKGYGRVVRGRGGNIARIVEEKDATAAEKKIGEVFVGAMAAPLSTLKKMLPKTRARETRTRGGREMYLTTLPELLKDGARALAVAAEDGGGINTLAELARAEALWQRREAEMLAARGAVVAQPETLIVRGEAKCAPGVFLDAGVILEGRVNIAAGAHIGAHCILSDARIGKNARILPFSHLQQCEVGAECHVGPYARLRPAAALGRGAKVGNFVEVKNAALGAGAKANHLAYVGDAEVGDEANIGAGAITCNYDGRRKHKTRIGARAFIGSNAQLIAPVTIGADAVVAAGSSIARDVPPGALAVARAAQKNLSGRLLKNKIENKRAGKNGGGKKTPARGAKTKAKKAGR